MSWSTVLNATVSANVVRFKAIRWISCKEKLYGLDENHYDAVMEIKIWLRLAEQQEREREKFRY